MIAGVVAIATRLVRCVVAPAPRDATRTPIGCLTNREVDEL